MNRKQAASNLEHFTRSVEDKGYFARVILGVDLWDAQEEILEAVFRYRDTAVKSCHASGKTFVAAVCALAWVRLHPPGEAAVIVTSSDWPQVEEQIFPTIRRLARGSAWAGDMGEALQIKLTLANGSYILGRSTNNPLGFHGFHARYILVIRDEFSGIDGVILNSMAGMRAGGKVAFLDLMNPVMATGPSVDRFDDPKVHKITIDALATPNMAGYHIYESPEANEADPDKEHNILYLSCLAGDEDEACEEPDCPLDGVPRPELVGRRFIREMYQDEIRKHGSLKPESDWWPKVRGMFPEASDAMLIPKGFVDAANVRVVDSQDYEVAGIDVAGPGEDETTCCIRSGMRVVREAAWASANTATIVGFVGPPRANLWLNIDRQGIGWGMYDELKRKGYQINGLNAGDSPYDGSLYDSFKSEMYWKVRLAFMSDKPQERIGGPIDTVTRHQLVQIKWDQDNARRQIHIESKKEARKRGVRSPDRAEALILAFAASPQRQKPQEWRYPQSDKNKPKGTKWIQAMRRQREKAGLVRSAR